MGDEVRGRRLRRRRPEANCTSASRRSTNSTTAPGDRTRQAARLRTGLELDREIDVCVGLGQRVCRHQIVLEVVLTSRERDRTRASRQIVGQLRAIDRVVRIQRRDAGKPYPPSKCCELICTLAVKARVTGTVSPVERVCVLTSAYAGTNTGKLLPARPSAGDVPTGENCGAVSVECSSALERSTPRLREPARTFSVAPAPSAPVAKFVCEVLRLRRFGVRSETHLADMQRNREVCALRRLGFGRLLRSGREVADLRGAHLQTVKVETMGRRRIGRHGVGAFVILDCGYA